MPSLRRSLSTHWKRPKDRKYQCISDPIEPPRTSIDTLVIPGRTRYPSDKITSTAPPPDEPPIVQAKYLVQLSEELPARPKEGQKRRTSSLRRSLSENLLSLPRPLDGALDNVFITPSASRSLSRNVSSSGYSAISRAPSSCISQLPPPRDRDTARFSEEYNRLASQYQLGIISRLEEGTIDTVKTPRSKHWLMNKLALTRKTSISSFTRPQRIMANKSQSLDTIFRLGGYSAFHLTSSKRHIEFYIPTPLAATAQYLLKYGYVGGIFRKSGSSSTVTAMYNHFTFTSAKGLTLESPTVEATIGSAELPGIHIDPHDVASLFKKCLWDVAGGIMGSIALFKVLREITGSAPESARTKLAALALLNLQSSRRLDVISAVFSLLSHLKNDRVSERVLSSCSVRPSTPNSEHMSSRALGVVFAPLMLGDLVLELECDTSQPSPSKRSIFQLSKSKHAQSMDQSNALSIEKRRMDLCSDLAEMLIKSWDDIARQMYLLETVLHKPLPTPNAVFKENIRAIRSSPSTYPAVADKPQDFEPFPSAPRTYSTRSSSGLAHMLASPVIEVPSIFERTPARSASLHDSTSPHVPEMGSVRQLPHSATTVDLRAGARWPSMHTITPYYSHHAHSVTELPWWERPESQSSPIKPSNQLDRHPSTPKTSSAAIFSRPASASTGLGQPIAALSARHESGPLSIPQLAFSVAAEAGVPGPQTLTNESVSTANPCSSPSDDMVNRSSNSTSRKSSFHMSDESSRSGSQRVRVSALYMKILHLEERLQAREEENRALRARISAMAKPCDGNDLQVPTSSAGVRKRYDMEARLQHRYLMTRPRVASSADSGWEEGAHPLNKEPRSTSEF